MKMTKKELKKKDYLILVNEMNLFENWIYSLHLNLIDNSLLIIFLFTKYFYCNFYSNYEVIRSYTTCVVFWPSTRPNMPFQSDAPEESNTFQWPVIERNRRQIWLTKWDKVKAHDTLIVWCTGREWPLNCMTVISARWQSNMPFQRYWVGDWTIM